MSTTLSIIVAAAENGVIGRDGDLPWRLSADLKRFRKITTGHPIVMGRRTWESIGKPLPGRTSVVVTRQSDYEIDYDEVKIAGSLDAALEMARESPGGEEVFLIGGALLYEAALALADKLYFTHVEAELAGDAVLPTIDWQLWQCVEQEQVAADKKNEYPHTFAIYERKS